MMNWSKCFNL